MLRACILDHKGIWEEHLALVEFADNNSYQASIQMAPYEAYCMASHAVPQGVSLLSICHASRWHEDVPGSSSPILLERDEKIRRGLCSTMYHVSASEG